MDRMYVLSVSHSPTCVVCRTTHTGLSSHSGSSMLACGSTSRWLSSPRWPPSSSLLPSFCLTLSPPSSWYFVFFVSSFLGILGMCVRSAVMDRDSFRRQWSEPKSIADSYVYMCRWYYTCVSVGSGARSGRPRAVWCDGSHWY